MLLDIVVIVLRETLEASVLIGVLLSLSQHAQLRIGWLPVAFVLGLPGAWIYGANLHIVSDWFEYTGQEVVNAGLQYLIYSQLLLILAFWKFDTVVRRRGLIIMMSIVVATAIIREGSELFVFYAGFLQSGGDLLNAFTSGFIGLAIGMSVGAICYYLLVAMPMSRAHYFHALLLVLIGSGMVAQATRLLAQADWVSVGQPVWDSNWLLPESSISGQLIYAIFGYEATPSSLEISIYILSMLAMLMAIYLGRSRIGIRKFGTRK